MTVTVDVATESIRTDTSTLYSFSHAGGTFPRGVAVSVIHGVSSTDHISGITYGGVSLKRQKTASRSAGEPGRSDWWFLGKSVPPGTQNVVASLSATTDDIQFVCVTLNAADDLFISDRLHLSGDINDPSVTLESFDLPGMALSALYWGGGASSATPNANMTAVHTHDFAGQSFSARVDRQTTGDTADFINSYDTNQDDTALVAIRPTEKPAIPLVVIRNSGDHGGVDSFTTGSFFFQYDSVYLIFIMAADESFTIDPGPDADGHGLTWTPLEYISDIDQQTDQQILWVAQGVGTINSGVTTGPTSMSVTIDGNSIDQSSHVVLEIFGADIADPIVQHAQNTGINTTAISVALNSFMDINNRPILFATNDNNSSIISEEGGWTTLYESSDAGPPQWYEHLAWHASSSDNTPTMTNSIAADWGAIALEIRARSTPFTRRIFVKSQAQHRANRW